MDLGSYHEGMADKKKPRRYCAHCGNPIKEKGPLITERRWYHNECLPNELMLQMMFRPAHDPGAPVTEVELEELCRWMTSSETKRLALTLRDLTKEQTAVLEKRTQGSLFSVHILADDEVDPKKRRDLR